MKNLTLQEIMSEVSNNTEMFEAYCLELTKRQIQWSNKGCKIAGKKVGIQKFVLAQKYAAQSVYLKFNS